MAFPKFPWTNFHQLNADWLLETVESLKASVEETLATLHDYDSRLSSAEGDIDDLQAELASVSSQVRSLTQTLAQLRADAVLTTSQSLTSEKQTQARQNIAAAAAADLTALATSVNNSLQTINQQLNGLSLVSVKTVSQSLTAAQKATARANIEAAQAPYVITYWSSGNDSGCDRDIASICDALENGQPIEIRYKYQENATSFFVVPQYIFWGNSITASFLQIPDPYNITEMFISINIEHRQYGGVDNIYITYTEA